MNPTASPRFIATAPLSQGLFDRMAKIAQSAERDVGVMTFAALADIFPGLIAKGEGPRLRVTYKVDRVAFVGGLVIRIWPTRNDWVVIDEGSRYLELEVNTIQKRLKAAIVRRYALPADDPKLF